MIDTTRTNAAIAAVILLLAPGLSQAEINDIAVAAMAAPGAAEAAAPVSAPLFKPGTPLAAPVAPAAASTLAVTAVPAAATAVRPAQPAAAVRSPLIATPVALKTQAPIAKVEHFKEADVWGRIRTGYAIPDLSNELVAKHVNYYSSRPDSLVRISTRASRYMFHVVQELEKRNMPTELALLPIIESAFNPQAYSSAKAAGMWQFVPGTGRDYDLQQNMFKDERRGVLKSTDAALSYLQKLYTMFGDWPLALAAYNWGEGNVQRAIKKNQALGKPTDYESLAPHMPAETRNYVPKLQAVKNIIANPAQYNVALPAIDNQPYFTAIDKTSDIDLTVAAQLAELSIEEFKALNPQFNRPVIIGGEQTKILLPQQNAEKFKLNLAQWGRALSSWTTHRITGAKESLSSLAARFGTTPDALRQANNIPARTRLKAGSTILVPKTAATAHTNIAEHVADTAVMAFEAERTRRPARAKKISNGQRIKASAASTVAKIKARTGKSSTKVASSSRRKARNS
jgi:membrane-bound lytic murein transglycosylase D